MKRQIAIDDFMQLELVSDLALHPLGNKLVYVVHTINEEKKYVSHLRQKNLQTNEERDWTFGDHKEQAPAYSFCGNYIAFLSNRTGTNQLYIMPVDGGEARQMTTFPYGISNFQWGRDGMLFFQAALDEAFTGEEKELTDADKEKMQKEAEENPRRVTRLKYKMEGLGFIKEEQTSHIYTFNLRENEIKAVTEGERNHYLADVSRCGNYVLYLRKTSDNEDLEETMDAFIYHLNSGEAEQVTHSDLAIYGGKFSRDSKAIAFVGHDLAYKSKTLPKIYHYTIESKELSNLSEDWDLPIGDFLIGDTRLGGGNVGPVWNEAGDELYFIGTDQGRTAIYKTNLQGDLSIVYDNNCHIFDFVYKKGQIHLAMSHPLSPGNIYSLHNGEAEQITEMNEDFLKEVHLSEPEEEWFTAEDGTKLQGWLLKPYDFDPKEKYPFILEVHGGPHMMYGLSFFHELQYLAGQGYVVLFTNPRGSHGYGQDFVNAIRNHYGEGDYTDLMTAVDQTLEKYDFIDEKRLGVTGGSYGGFMTNWIVGHTDRFKAAVTQRSISNWISFYGVSDIGYFFNQYEHGINLTEDVETLWDKSPLKYVNDVETPLLILHGENDLRCPIEQAEQFYVALKHLDKDVEFVRFPNATHELSRSGEPKMRQHRLEEIRGWFDRYLI